jgi:acetyl-CoA acetyltransferase
VSLSGRCVIAGIGHTAFGKLPGRDIPSLHVEACREALNDAGIDKSLVDAVFVKVPTSAPQFMVGQKVAEALGITPRIGGAWDQGGAANITLLSFAVMAIEAGQCDVALVSYADNPRSGNRAVFARPRGDDAPVRLVLHRRRLRDDPAPACHRTRHATRGLRRRGLASRRHGAGNPHGRSCASR